MERRRADEGARHVIGWVGPRYRRWQASSSQEQVESSTRWMLVAYAWLTSLGFVVRLAPAASPEPVPHSVAWGVVGLGLVQCLLCTGMLRRALDGYLGVSTLARSRLVLPGALVASMTVLTLTLAAVGAVEGGVDIGLALYGSLAPFTVIFGITAQRRTLVLALGGYLAVTLGTLAATSATWRTTLAAGLMAALGALLSVFTGRSSAWYIAVIRELEEARGVQARLAVTEERLRFSRDLHDVMGRNLSAIALKSELAAQLAQRGTTDAATEQMTEVQRIARESQSEVRAVVRGYRGVDLATELAGARGILRAAGVDCRTENGGSELPAPVQAALGWVVREGATNVLRHADATWCRVWVGTEPGGGSALLVMENDGVRGPVGGDPGSGLAGLRERLDGVGGTLRTERTERTERDEGTFRLRADVPLGGEPGGRAADGRRAAVDGRATAGADGARGGPGDGVGPGTGGPGGGRDGSTGRGSGGGPDRGTGGRTGGRTGGEDGEDQ